MEEKTTSEMLEEVLKEEIQNLAALQSGSEKKSSAIDDLATLYKLKIEENKVKGEIDEKYYSRMMEEAHHIDELESNTREDKLKNDQLKEQQMDRYFRYGVEVLGIVTSLCFYGAYMDRGFKFEETGSYTSKTFMGLINRFKPTRK